MRKINAIDLTEMTKYKYIICYCITGTLHSTAIYVLEYKLAGMEQWRKKGIFLYADGVNMAKKNGVAAKLKSSLDHIIVVHCIAHRLELGVSKSFQDSPLTFE